LVVCAARAWDISASGSANKRDEPNIISSASEQFRDPRGSRKNATNVGLRHVCSLRHGQEVFESLKDRSEFTGYTGQNWNRRYREYSEKLKSTDLSDVAYVLKELFLIGMDKELSFGERRLLEQAMTLVSMELAFALGGTGRYQSGH
jgi:hypothetical protein